MTRVKRKAIGRKSEGCPGEILRGALLAGHAYRHDADGRRLAIPTAEDLREAWARLGEELTAEHVEKHPGTRPWGWWRFTDGALLLPHVWPLHIQHGAVRTRDRLKPGVLIQRLALQMAGEMSDGELAAVNEREPLSDDEAREMWNHLHQREVPA